jgi:hypothetical protein
VASCCRVGACALRPRGVVRSGRGRGARCLVEAEVTRARASAPDACAGVYAPKHGVGCRPTYAYGVLRRLRWNSAAGPRCRAASKRCAPIEALALAVRACCCLMAYNAVSGRMHSVVQRTAFRRGLAAKRVLQIGVWRNKCAYTIINWK